MTSSTDSFTAAGVRTEFWDVAPGTTARGTLVLLTGRGEHPGAYDRFGKRIAFDGYRVHVVDTADQETAATLAASPGMRYFAPPYPDMAPHLAYALRSDAVDAHAAYASARAAVDALQFTLAPAPSSADASRRPR